MASRISGNQKVCVTCEYWCGERTPCDSSRMWVEYNQGERAKCMVNANQQTNSNRPACPKYRKLGWMRQTRGKAGKEGQMNIRICSRKEATYVLQNEDSTNTAIISFGDPIEEGQNINSGFENCLKKAKYCFRIEVWDIYYDELKDYGLSYEVFFPEATELAKFIKQAVYEECNLICQCEYGQSRSAGCAAAILEYYKHKGITIFADYRYCPNQMIFHKIYDALTV